MTKNKALLVILDGWGFGDKTKRDIISETPTPYWDSLLKNYPYSQLQASGENVGLPDGQMGNSEVGHLNIGAGRIVYQDLVKINIAARTNTILENQAIKKAYSYAKENNKQIHLMGLVSNGGVHSSMEHLFKLTEISKTYGVNKTFVHCFMDGRDTDPKSGAGFIAELEEHLKATTGQIASVIGRYYAMDRDKRWERVKKAYDALVNGIGEKATNAVTAIESYYQEETFDEFILPTLICNNDVPVATIEKNDSVIFFNYRTDRARELTRTLVDKDFKEFETKKDLNLYYVCMTEYDATMPNVHVAFKPTEIKNTFGEYVSKLGLTQLRIAETEK